MYICLYMFIYVYLYIYVYVCMFKYACIYIYIYIYIHTNTYAPRCDLLRAGRSGIESRWGGGDFSPIQTVPGAYPTSCTMDTGSFPGVKWSGLGVDHSRPPIAEVKERELLFVYSPCEFSWPIYRVSQEEST